MHVSVGFPHLAIHFFPSFGSNASVEFIHYVHCPSLSAEFFFFSSRDVGGRDVASFFVQPYLHSIAGVQVCVSIIRAYILVTFNERFEKQRSIPEKAKRDKFFARSGSMLIPADFKNCPT